MQTNKIKIAFIKKEKFQTQLARELGKSFRIINVYCNNRQAPSLKVLNEIEKILPMNIKDL